MYDSLLIIISFYFCTTGRWAGIPCRHNICYCHLTRVVQKSMYQTISLNVVFPVYTTVSCRQTHFCRCFPKNFGKQGCLISTALLLCFVCPASRACCSSVRIDQLPGRKSMSRCSVSGGKIRFSIILYCIIPPTINL